VSIAGGRLVHAARWASSCSRCSRDVRAVTRSFGPPEFFLLVMMGMMTLIVMIDGDWRYGVISALIGFALGTVGVDLETGQTRFTFGSAEMIGGIDFIPIAIGLFGLGELYYAFYQGMHLHGSGGIVQYQKEKRFWPEWRDYAETKFAILRGSILGFVIGIIPGAGATIASFMSYTLEKTVSATPEKFGKGMMAGLVGPEAANNAPRRGRVVPLLSLGLPGSGSTAVLLAAFLMWGLTPGAAAHDAEARIRLGPHRQHVTSATWRCSRSTSSPSRCSCR